MALIDEASYAYMRAGGVQQLPQLTPSGPGLAYGKVVPPFSAGLQRLVLRVPLLYDLRVLTMAKSKLASPKALTGRAQDLFLSA
jgi:hypothetical protein